MDCHKKFYNTFLNNKIIQVLANDICFDKKKNPNEISFCSMLVVYVKMNTLESICTLHNLFSLEFNSVNVTVRIKVLRMYNR